MRLLLDECVPRPLKRHLVGYDVWHVTDMGWSSKRNGALLELMVAEKFDTLLTVDQGIEFQQNVRASGIGVVVVLASTNRLKELRPLVPHMLDALARVTAGELIRVVANTGLEPPRDKARAPRLKSHN
jgi:hypothetical protein